MKWNSNAYIKKYELKIIPALKVLKSDGTVVVREPARR
jgi:hypothetical protein